MYCNVTKFNLFSFLLNVRFFLGFYKHVFIFLFNKILGDINFDTVTVKFNRKFHFLSVIVSYIIHLNLPNFR